MEKKTTRTLWSIRVERDDGVLLHEGASAFRYACNGLLKLATGAAACGLAAGTSYAVSKVPEAGEYIQQGIAYLSEKVLGHPSSIEGVVAFVTSIWGFSKSKLDINSQTQLFQGLRFGESYWSREYLSAPFRAGLEYLKGREAA